MTCPSCSGEVRVGAKFCSACGSPIDTSTSAAPPTPDTPHTRIEAEGRAIPPTPPVQGARSLAGDLRETTSTPASGDGGGSRRKLAIATAVVAAAAALAVVGWMFFLSGGGSGSPEEAVQEFVDAINSGDSLAVVNALAPSESEGLAAVADQLVTSIGVDREDGDFVLTIELDEVDVVEQGDMAALVEIEGRIRNDYHWGWVADTTPIDLNDVDTDGILDELDDEGVDEIDAITIAAVQEDGEWYVSPFLTVGDYVTRGLNMPEADWRAADELPDAAASSRAEAVEDLIDAVIDLDAEAIAASTDLGVARAATIFEEAIDEAEIEGWDSSRVAVRGLDLDDVESGVAVAGATLRVEDEIGSDGFEVEFDGWCGEGSAGDEACATDVSWLELAERPEIRTTDERGGTVVDASATVSWYAEQVVASLDRTLALHLIWRPDLADGQQAPLGRSLEVAFGDDPFVAIDIAVDDDQYPIIGTESLIIAGMYYREEQDDPWERTNPSERRDAGTLRYVVVPADDDGRACFDWLCDWPTGVTGRFTSRANHLQQLDEFPDSRVSGDLAGFDANTFEFDPDEYVEFSIDVPEGFEVVMTAPDSAPWASLVEYDPERPTEPTTVDFTAEPGTRWLWVINATPERRPFEIEPDVTFSAADTGTGVVNTFSLPMDDYEWFTGFDEDSFVQVRAYHNDSADIVLDAYTQTDSCRQDSEISAAEECLLDVGSGGEVAVRIEPYRSDDNYGSVVVEVVPL